MAQLKADIKIVPVAETDKESSGEDIENYPGLHLKHLRIQYSHHRRIARGISKDLLDPLVHEVSRNEKYADFEQIYSKIRHKRQRHALEKLENDYIRCKKESLNHKECMVAFVKMYNIAKEMSEKMEKMKEFFKHETDSSISSRQIVQDIESSASDKPMQSEELIASISNEDVANETSSTISSIIATENVSANNNTASEEETTIGVLDSKPIKSQIIPSKISWIIDGNDEYGKLTESAEKTSTQDTTNVSSSQESNTTDTSIMTTPISEASTIVLENNTTQLTTSTQETTTTEHPSDKISWILDDDVAENEVESVDLLSSSTDAAVAELKTTADLIENNKSFASFSLIVASSTGDSVRNLKKELESSTDSLENDVEKMRKLKIAWIIDGGEEPSEENTAKSNINITTTTTATSIPEMQTNTTIPTIPTEDDKKPLVISWIIDNDVVLEETTTEAIENTTISLNKQSNSTHAQNAKFANDDQSHPLDNPSSLENMLDDSDIKDKFNAFMQERKDLNEKNNNNETFADPYDKEMWEKKFKETAAIYHPQSELIDTFGEFDNMKLAKFGPKLNPVNNQGFRGKKLFF